MRHHTGRVRKRSATGQSAIYFDLLLDLKKITATKRKKNTQTDQPIIFHGNDRNGVRPRPSTWQDESRPSTLNVKQLVVDQPPAINLQHAKGVQKDHPEIRLAKTH